MASTALASPALARDGQWYVEVDGGVMIVEDQQFDIDNGSDSFGLDSDNGYDFGGIVGYDFGAFRLEAEASYRQWELDSVNPGSTGVPAPPFTLLGTSAPANGDPSTLSFMLNGMFDFGNDDGLQAFAGAGIGVARTDIDVDINSIGGLAVDDSDSGLAWQLIAGVRAPLSESWDVGLKYRMFTHTNVQLVDAIGRNIEDDVRTHSILGTLTYNFGGPPPPPPPPPPVAAPPPPPPVVQAPPPPPPPPPCNRGPYIVFFDWDQSDITPAAANILDNARSAYANCGMASVMLAGHADRSGSVSYNEGLAQRRNSSVREYLTARGIADARITSQGFGESQNMVPTADGVRELQNRRVEVTYGPGSGM